MWECPHKNVTTYSQETSQGADVDDTRTSGRFLEQWKKLLGQIHGSKVIDVQAFHSFVVLVAQYTHYRIVDLAIVTPFCL